MPHTDRPIQHTSDIPNANGLIQRSTNYQILFWMELSTHDIMIVSSQNGNALTRLPVPNANGLIIRSGYNPGVFMMKKHGSNVVQVPSQREQTATLLIIPNFDFVIVAARNEQRLRRVKSNATHGTCDAQSVNGS